MKKAFTLVELMVVVVVIAILASISFKIAGFGENTSKVNTTIARMQRLENAISGYFAAYGSYPPVALQGRSRNIFYEVSDYGIQQVSRDPQTSIDLRTEKGWKQVEAACRAQPVAMQFPYASSQSAYVRAVSESLKQLHESGTKGYENPVLANGFDALENPEILKGKNKDGPGVKAGDWTNLQLFQFGLMSYLLPRYLLMMGHGNGVNNTSSGSTTIYDDFVQWGDNNAMPCRFEDGTQYASWGTLNSDLGDENEKWKIALIPTQAVCARWMPNLENLLACSVVVQPVYGVNVRDPNAPGALSAENPDIKVYSPANSQSGGMGGMGSNGGGSSQYVLNEISCKDGWNRDFYYYSLPPYQSYRLWSAGENGKTFPPWIPDEEIDNNSALQQYKDLIRNWVTDDIVHMSN